MLNSTRGIIFHKVKYSDTSIIARIYTELFGLQTYMLRRTGSKKSLAKPTLVQPLSLVELIVYHKEKKEIQHIKEIKIDYPFKTVYTDIRKSSVLIFLNEILYQVIREQEPNPPLFTFLYNSIVALDELKSNIADFHLHFLIQLTKYIGFFPKKNFSEENSVFNLQEGIFTNQKTLSDITIQRPFSDYIATLIGQDIEPLIMNPEHRIIMLEYVIRYYKFHVPEIKEIKSHLIFQTVLND